MDIRVKIEVSLNDKSKSPKKCSLDMTASDITCEGNIFEDEMVDHIFNKIRQSMNIALYGDKEEKYQILNELKINQQVIKDWEKKCKVKVPNTK